MGMQRIPMKTKALKSLVVSIFILLAGGMSAVAAEVGKAAPDFMLTDINGESHQLSDFRGKTVVLEWMNQGCPFVKKHYNSGNMPQLQQEALSDGVIWLVINSGRPGAQGDLSPEEVKAWSQKKGASFTAYFRDSDGRVGNLYNAKVTPHMYVINPAGELVYNGAIDSIRSAKIADIEKAENYVRSALRSIKEGQPVRTSVTRPYGCSVKY